MTFPPPPTTVVLKPAGGVLCSSAMSAAVTINLVEQMNHPCLCRKHCTQCVTANATGIQIALRSRPPIQPKRRSSPHCQHFPHSAPPTAASFNPASMRSRSPQRSTAILCRATSQNPQDSDTDMALQVLRGVIAGRQVLPIKSLAGFPRPSVARFQVPQIRASLAMTRCRPASIPLGAA